MIPIQNLYFILCYAWRRFDEKDLVDVDALEHKDLPNLLAKVLLNGCRRLIKMGIDREYRVQCDDATSPRGKFLVNESIKRRLLDIPKVHCEADDLTANVLHNRILRCTLTNLSKSADVATETRHQIGLVLRHLGSIEPIVLSPRLFRAIQLHRNNAFYGFLLDVCYLLYESRLPEQTQGYFRMRDLIRDEVQMRKIFEDFLFNFYATEQKRFRVTREKIGWDATSEDPEAIRVLPEMRTDIFLRSDTRSIIVEAKYTEKFFQEHWGKKTLQSKHLYQIHSYLTQANSDQRQLEGILIYPSTSGAREFRYQISGHRLKVAALDLNCNWKAINDQLIELLA